MSDRLLKYKGKLLVALEFVTKLIIATYYPITVAYPRRGKTTRLLKARYY